MIAFLLGILVGIVFVTAAREFALWLSERAHEQELAECEAIWRKHAQERGLDG